MDRLSVHLGNRPPALTPCRLRDGWAAFEAAAFTTLGVDARAFSLHSLWLCDRDGEVDAIVARDAMHALRDGDHVRMMLAPRAAAAAELAKAAPPLARAAPPAAVARPPATPATAPPVTSGLAALLDARVAPPQVAAPPTQHAAAAAAAPVKRDETAPAGGKKRPAAEAAGAAGEVTKHKRTAASLGEAARHHAQRRPSSLHPVDRAPPAFGLRCKWCQSTHTAHYNFRKYASDDFASDIHRCKECSRTFKVATVTLDVRRREMRRARAARAGGQEVSDDSDEDEEVGEEEEDDEEAEGMPQPDGKDESGAHAETHPQSPCPRCASERTTYRCTKPRIDGVVTRFSCKDCNKMWATAIMPWKSVEWLASTGVGDSAEHARRALLNRPLPPADHAGSRKAAPAAKPAAAVPAAPSLAVPDVDADACELPTIAPRLWIGAATAAANLGWLRARGITHVVNVAIEVPDYFPAELTYHSLRLRDSSDDVTQMMGALPAAHAFIDGALAAGGAVLVHCLRGMSRSGAVVASYGMQRGVPLADALSALSHGRHGLSINFAFRAMLELLQQRHAGTDGVRHTRSSRAR